MRRQIIIGSTFACILAGVVACCVWSIAPLRQDMPIIPSTKILDRNGKLLYEISRPDEGVRTLAVLADIPSSLKNAVIAAEDRRFYQHHGVDFFANLRALVAWIRTGERQGGASTIEQQLIKILYFPTHKRTMIQKAREMIAAIAWAQTHTKDHTIERYLNTIYFGNRAYGVTAAASTYFRKDLASLTMAESALLAGIIPAPSAYDLIQHRANATQRQAYVLERMRVEGMITQEQKQAAQDETTLIFLPMHTIIAPHFVFHVLNELDATYPDIASGGYTIHTTLDSDLQTLARDVMARKLVTLAKQHVTNGATLAVDPRTGDVLAYVGSNGYFDDAIDGKIDMVTAQRQPGSALKPFMYLTAFLHGFTPASVIADLPVQFTTADGKDYTPQNYGHTYSGPISIHDALGSSLNIPAVKVLDAIGLSAFFDTLTRIGIVFPKSPEYYGLGIVLGGGETTLWDVTRGYAILSQQGRNVTLRMVTRIENAAGTEIFRATTSRAQSVFADPQTTQQAIELVTDVLIDPMARARSFGESTALNLGKDSAVKTGTTRDFRDNWAFGYTPNFALGVWVGNADNTPMEGVTGVTGAVPIWHDIMAFQLRNDKIIEWPHDESLITRTICTTSGLLANHICPKTRIEKFISGTEPTQSDNWYVRACGKIYLVPPAEYVAWQTAAQHEKMPNSSFCGIIDTISL